MEAHNQSTAVKHSTEGAEPVAMETKDTPASVRALDVLILGGLTAFGPLSTDMYLPALPTVSQDLSATMSQTQVTLTAGILGLSLGQVLVGPISDARGRRRPLLIGIAAFVLASLLCILAPSVTALTTVRFAQGVAGAAGIVLALAIARDSYTGIALARCISLLMMVNFIAPLVAPVIGGQLITFTSWRGIFGALAILGVVGLIAVAFGVRETLPASRRQHGGIVATLRAFRALLSDRGFLGYAFTCGFAAAGGIIYISSSPFILQNVYGLSPVFVSFVFGANALGLTIMAQVSARLAGRVSPQTLLTWGALASGIGGVGLLLVVLAGIGLAGVLLSFFVVVASLGLIFPNATALALTKVNSDIAGSASALLGVLQFSIGAIVAPLVGTAGATTAFPMAACIAAFGLATLTTFIIFCREQ